MATAETLTDADFMAPAAEPVAGPVLTDADFHGEQSPPNISAPPVPQATTLLSDRNIVVGHPMDMSHDQVNDAIQTQIYGRPRIDWHWGAQTPTEKQQSSFLFGASLAPKDLWEVAKAGVRGVEGAVTGLAGLLKWTGETVANQPDEDMEAVGNALSGIADKAVSFIKARQEKGFEAPDPEVFRGSFVSNPSFTRLAASVTQGLPALAAASALTIGTGNPLAGAGALGLISAGEQYESSREFGSTPEKAGKTAIASGIGNTLLMELPLGKVLTGFGQEGLQSAARGAAEFAGISAVMTPFNNIVAKIGGDQSRRIFDGMAESLLSGAVTGGIMGTLTPGRGAEIDGLIQDAHKAGVPAKDIDAARAEIAKQMVENPDAVMGAIKNVAVYNDIKDQLSAIPKPEAMTPEEWNQNIDSNAKIWAARVTAEAAKRGVPVEEVYAGMRPKIEAATSSEAGALLQPQQESPNFYSAVQKTIEEKMPAKATPEQVEGLLKNSPGVKQEEMDWIGLPEFLKGKKSVTKEEVQDFIRENNVQVQEVTKVSDDAKEKRFAELQGIGGNRTEAEEAELRSMVFNRGRTGDTKFDRYTLPGGENYRELLLTLPDTSGGNAQRMDEIEQKLQNSGDYDESELVALRKEYKRLADNTRGETFKSSHFSEPNILAHVRFNDRTDTEGKKVLFLEEVQSDWHQQGREKGYTPNVQLISEKESAHSLLSDLRNHLKASGSKIDEVNDFAFTYESPKSGKKILAIENAPYGTDDVLRLRQYDVTGKDITKENINTILEQGPIPNAPFKKTWHELALKRMLRYAAENGYDKLAWTRGEQQAERYDLSKQLESVRATVSNRVGGGNDLVNVRAYDKSGTQVISEMVPKDKLPDTIGKELAAKILAQTPGDEKVYSGLDLKVGGEGMKGFYDKIIPSFLNKYAKKWGGKVGESEISKLGGTPSQENFPEAISTVHSLDITPAMKESVMGGQPLFQGEAVPRGMTRFTPEGAVISLMKNADASTFLHESAHVWLKDIHNFIQSGKANEAYLKDWSTIKEWLKIEDGQERLTTDQHETFARGFESYLREGQAPTEGLKGTFERFRQWLVNIYKNAQELKVELSPEIRQVMDSMLDYSKGEGQYVINRPFNVSLGENDKLTARNIREQFTGLKNEQIVRGNQLADEVRQMVPKKAEREGMFWYKAAQGDMNVLAEALNDTKMAAYHDQIKAAMDLSPKAIEALQKVNRYYEEAGSVSKEIGTIGNVRENYQNRIYAPEPPKDFVKTEVRSGLKQGTAHAKARVFDTEFEAAQAGKKFATTDVSDALSIHNEEMARVNTSRKLAEFLVDSGLAAWKKDIPDGWDEVGTIKKRVPIKDKNGEAVIGDDGNQVISQSALVAPKGIAKGLAAVADQDFIKKVDTLRNIHKYQGLVKTVDLSFSFFHHFTMGMQSLYQGGVRALLHAGTMNDQLNSQEFRGIEQDFVQHTGMTAKVESNQDILRNLVQKNDDFFSKTANLPVVRNILSTADKSSEFLFGKVQRYLKVSDYGAKISNWVADHPNATNPEVIAAKKGFAKEINAAYGGLNWEAMGMTKSNLSLLRLALLAPDWSISNYELLKYAVGDSGTAGQASRSHIITALVGGMVLTEGLNKILTGHFTDENKSGHALEVEISPNVYVSLLRGGIGDITKFSSMIADSGAAGAFRFAQGKLSPFARTVIGLASNTQYTGRPIYKHGEGPIANTYDVLKYLLSSAAPMPLGVSNFFQYMQERDRTPQGAAAVLTGLGRYSKSGHNTSKLKM